MIKNISFYLGSILVIIGSLIFVIYGNKNGNSKDFFMGLYF
ncbi:hypothetical protein [Cetobacterium ceti]